MSRVGGVGSLSGRVAFQATYSLLPSIQMGIWSFLLLGDDAQECNIPVRVFGLDTCTHLAPPSQRMSVCSLPRVPQTVSHRLQRRVLHEFCIRTTAVCTQCGGQLSLGPAPSASVQALGLGVTNQRGTCLGLCVFKEGRQGLWPRGPVLTLEVTRSRGFVSPCVLASLVWGLPELPCAGLILLFATENPGRFKGAILFPFHG